MAMDQQVNEYKKIWKAYKSISLKVNYKTFVQRTGHSSKFG